MNLAHLTFNRTYYGVIEFANISEQCGGDYHQRWNMYYIKGKDLKAFYEANKLNEIALVEGTPSHRMFTAGSPTNSLIGVSMRGSNEPLQDYHFYLVTIHDVRYRHSTEAFYDFFIENNCRDIRDGLLTHDSRDADALYTVRDTRVRSGRGYPYRTRSQLHDVVLAGSHYNYNWSLLIEEMFEDKHLYAVADKSNGIEFWDIENQFLGKIHVVLDTKYSERSDHYGTMTEPFMTTLTTFIDIYSIDRPSSILPSKIEAFNKKIITHLVKRMKDDEEIRIKEHEVAEIKFQQRMKAINKSAIPNQIEAVVHKPKPNILVQLLSKLF